MPTLTAATESPSGSSLSDPVVDQPGQRAVQRHVGAADGRAARAAVGLDDVAVDPDRALAEPRRVDDASQRAADQPLDLDRATVDATA